MADTKSRRLASNLAHPIEEALSRFTLIGGVGDGKQTACAMSLLNWIWGDSNKWTDSPECVHPLIRVVVITANDASDTTPEMRAELVRLGERGALDTWWVPDVVVTASLAAPIGADPPGDYDRAVGCLVRIAAWKDAPVHERPNLADATLAGADLTRATLAGADLARATLAGATLVGAILAGADLVDAILAGADLTRANLTGATGNKRTSLPVGWKVAGGFVVRGAQEPNQ